MVAAPNSEEGKEEEVSTYRSKTFNLDETYWMASGQQPLTWLLEKVHLH